MALHALRNPVKHYAWGSHTALPQLLSAPSPSDEPWAELWIGAHPRGSSDISVHGSWVPLRDWIASDPEHALGHAVAHRYGELPFLLKVLAADQPLSLQAHPDAAGARAGWEREEAAGVALDAPERSFADPNPKPELVVALDRFEVLCGVRPLPDISRALEALDAPIVVDHFRTALAGGDPHELLRVWLGTPPPGARSLIEAATAAAGQADPNDPAVAWIPRLARAHPGDIGALAPLFLTYRDLAPGAGLFVGAGVLHGYLCGTALELQASSDNVLRGGLTGKHVDLELLLEVLEPAGVPQPCVPQRETRTGLRWPAGTDRFALRAEHPTPGRSVTRTTGNGPEILLCVEGRAEVSDGVVTLSLARGEALFVPGTTPEFALEGDGTVYRASAA
jgi:mannose-6-phosphate isomerase